MSQSKVLSNSIIYTLGGIITKCFAFFLLPLYTAYLTPEDYGITSIVTTFLNISSFVVSFSLYAAVLRLYVDYNNT
jgi:O-antigen/teichoic acid export membrane protein